MRVALPRASPRARGRPRDPERDAARPVASACPPATLRIQAVGGGGKARYAAEGGVNSGAVADIELRELANFRAQKVQNRIQANQPFNSLIKAGQAIDEEVAQ